MKNLRNLDQVPRSVPIYLYGAGKAGLTMRKALSKKSGVNLAGFVDSFKSGTADGLPVIPLSEFVSSRPAGAEVIITSMYVNEIAEQLDKHGIRDFYNGYPLSLSLIDEAVLRKNLVLIGSVLGLLAVVAAWFLL